MSRETRIKFGDKELKEALASYFKINAEKITFYHIGNFTKNHSLDYTDN